MSTRKTAAMHKAALKVLAKYDSSGEPFSLFLSSWAFDEARQLVLSLMSRDSRDVQVRIGLERQVRIVLKKDDLETVAVYRKGDEKRIAMPTEWPALSLEDDEWRARVEEIAMKADLIVLFWGVTSEGLTEELAICASGSNALKTVLVVNADLTWIFLSQLYKTFPRVVPLTEIPPLFALHPEFSPLIDRMKTIKSVARKARVGLVDPQERLERFPLPPTSGRFDKRMLVMTDR